ncbi:MAG: SDR family oxidoreductase [Oceanospirillaceae bacterium]|nr:SDR family oxidoreductase [Oceanospirillaceae bacterium]
MRILVTGANGFVGRHVCLMLEKTFEVVAAVRNDLALTELSREANGAHIEVVGEIDGDTDWEAALSGVDVVIHAAARAHVMGEQAGEGLAAYRSVNVDGSTALARQAVQVGVKRFIYLSSIKVNGEQTFPSRPFRSDNEPAPEDDYGQSKTEAEKALKEISAESDMELVIIRPPLVYGSGVKGNFSTLMRIARTRVPLPFGCISNRRSLVSVNNLTSLLTVCLTHPNAANRTFLVSDDQDLSTTELIANLRVAAGRSPRLICLPVNLCGLLLRLVGLKRMAERLFGSLQVDITDTKRMLKWYPPYDALEEFEKLFLESK